jgi:transposase
MARERISVRKISEVLRLTYEVGLSQRQVAASLGLANGTVATYLARAARAGICWPLPEGMSEAEVAHRLFPPTARKPVPSRRRDPDFAALHHELGRKGVTLLLLWQEYQALDPATSYSYPHFCVRYQAWRKRLKLSLRQVHHAGEKLFVDYAGPTVPVVDSQTGGSRLAQIFVAVLGYSNYTFAEATWTQSLPDWIGSHVRALQFFGGAPQLIVPDNLKAGVSKACRYEPELNPTYAEFAAHYHTAVLPARPYKPRDKAKVEVAVQLVERWILARLRHQQFYGLPQLNAAIGDLLTELNHRPFKKLPGTRYSQFVAHDQPALTSLPPTPYEYAEWKQARVNIDYHIEVAGHYYSVPHRLVRQRVDVRLTAAMLEVFHQGERVASHRRSPRPGSFTTLSAHMPLSHQRHRDWTPGRFLTWAQTLGPHTHTLVEHLLHRRYPEQGYRSCLGLLNLVKRYGPTRLEAACQRALTLGAYTRRSVASILEHGLDREPLTTPLPPTLPVVHENLRGPTYYH